MKRIFAIVASLWFGACTHSPQWPCAKALAGIGSDPRAKPPTAFDLPARVTACMDCKTDPCQDFHQYACGGWIGAFETPSPAATSGVLEVMRYNRLALDDLFIDMVREHARDYPPSQFFLACLDDPDRTPAGLAALAPLLTAIETVQEPHDFMVVAGKLASVGVSGPFELHVAADSRGQNALLLGIAPHGARPPHATGDDAHVQAYVVATFAALGESHALAVRRADTLHAVEQAWTRGRVDESPRELTVAELDGIPQLALLGAFAEGAGLPPTTPLVIGEDVTARLLAKIPATDAQALRTYLRARVIDAFAPHAGRLISSYEALEQRAAGFTTSREAWCRSWTGRYFAEEIDRAWLADRFDAEARASASELLEEIIAALDRRLPEVAWLAGPAAARAHDRLARLRRYVGYPDRWLDIGSPALGESHLDNVVALEAAQWKANVERLGKPIDGIWVAPAHVVNAYYVPLLHAIEMPAAVLQAPLFARDYPRAYGLGAIGSVMGHELTHAFDLSAWLAASARELPGVEVVDARREAERCVERYYEATMSRAPFAGRGKKVVREAMADLGGVRMAFDALGPGVDDKGVRGLTQQQLFFVAYAQTECMLPQLEEAAARMGDTHPPASFRVNGVLAQTPAFAEAFACAPGTPMNPPDRCEAW